MEYRATLPLPRSGNCRKSGSPEPTRRTMTTCRRLLDSSGWGSCASTTPVTKSGDASWTRPCEPVSLATPMCATRSQRSKRSRSSERRRPASSSAWGRRRIPSENGRSTTARGRTEASRSPARPSTTESTRFSTSTSMRGPSDGCGRSTAARVRRTSWSRVTWLRTASASMCSSGSFGRAVCGSIRTVELSTSEHDYYYDIRYNSMVSLNYSLSIPEGRVPSAVRNRHREQHPPHAAKGHRRCVPPVPHADRIHPERLRPEDRRLECAGFGALPAVRRMPPGPDGQGVDGGTARGKAEDDEGDDLPSHQQAQGDGPPGRGECERARDDPQGLPDPIRKSLESMELRRIECGDRHGELPQDGRPACDARGATEVNAWRTRSSP